MLTHIHSRITYNLRNTIIDNDCNVYNVLYTFPNSKSTVFILRTIHRFGIARLIRSEVDDIYVNNSNEEKKIKMNFRRHRVNKKYSEQQNTFDLSCMFNLILS